MPYRAYKKAKSSAKRKRAASAVAGGMKRVRNETTTVMKLSRELPFPPVKEFCFLYESPLVNATQSVSGETNFLVGVNDLFDFDRSVAGYFRNKQPLYFDQLLTSSGPYKRYFVHHWDIYWTVINGETSTPLNVIHAGPTLTSTDIDTFTEVMSMPGTQMRTLGQVGGDNAKVVIHSKGNVHDAAGVPSRDKNYEGDWVSSPTNGIYESLTVNFPGYSSGTWKCYVAIQARLYATLYGADAVES